MDTFGNAALGLVFLGLAFVSTILMYKLWGYPFDEKTLRSAAPRPLMLLHRAIGYLYLAIYLYFMSQMLPRLWQYQVELPARTVAHLMLGMAIGVILLAKILIVRFFKYLESQMAPILGTALLLCTALLIGLSVPFALREHYLSSHAAGGSAFTEENLARVTSLLPLAGFPAEVPIGDLATKSALQQGRAVLLKKCVQCHDLRTVLLRPRTPSQWRETVARMAERAVLVEPFNEFEQRFVTAYLIAITPELQRSVKAVRQQEIEREATKAAIATVAASLPQAIAANRQPQADLEAARRLFEKTCSQCHGLNNVEKNPPANAAEATALLDRMIDNGLDVSDEEFEQLVLYLSRTYGKD